MSSEFIDRLTRAAYTEIDNQTYTQNNSRDFRSVLIDGEVELGRVIRAILIEARWAVTLEMLHAMARSEFYNLKAQHWWQAAIDVALIEDPKP